MNRLAMLMVLALIECIGCAREPVTVQQSLCQAGTGCCTGSPILVDLAGDGIHLTGPDEGVPFELHAGIPGLWAWTSPGSDDAFLALDRNGNGVIDDGTELFGDGSIQAEATNEPNGFLALAYFDAIEHGGNADGQIDSRDAIWPKLRLWSDADHDGASQPDELITLDAAHVHAFSLQVTPSTRTDAHGNAFRFESTIVADAPVGPIVSDVWLIGKPLPPTKRPVHQDTTTTWTCWSWGYFVSNDRLTECNTQFTANDPLVIFSDGAVTRLVARFSTSTGDCTIFSCPAAEQSLHLVQWAIGIGNPNGVRPCEFSLPWPDPDPFRAPPYFYTTSNFLPRAKCTSVTTGGTGQGC